MRYPALTLVLIALLAAPAATVLAQQHTHPVPTPSAAAAPANGYATDATLRQQMRVIRAEAGAIERAQQHNAAQPVADGAARIIAAVNTIIVNCKLPPDSDAALHGIIGPILQHAAALKADPAGIAAAAAIRSELARYARQFDDPGFAAPAR